MRRAIAIFLAVAALAATADTNELERARLAYLEARKAYMAAREAAGLTNAPRRKVAAGATSATVFSKSQKRFFENRRICISRDTTTIPGSVITTWYRNGRPDTKAPAVVTNVLHRISGAMQDNPLQSRIAALIERATSAEARAARLDRLKDWLIEQRDKAVLPTTKAIYQAILDKMESAN